MLQFITHYNDRYGYLDSVRLALEGGCRWVQLRVKDVSDDELRPMALQAQQMCRQAGATFIIDDHVELVRQIGADGVHLGLKDMPIAQARAILGPDVIIGGTANTYVDVVRHCQAGASYIGCGPFRFTTTKQNLSPVLGLEGYRSIVAQMRAADLRNPQGEPLPIVAIGGITADDIPAIMQTGVTGIALSGTVLNAPDPVSEVGQLLALIRESEKSED